MVVGLSGLRALHLSPVAEAVRYSGDRITGIAVQRENAT
jgi:hypothetical protein